MTKKFHCKHVGTVTLGTAVYYGFTRAIEMDTFKVVKGVEAFEALEVGEMYVDEDGDTWERVE